MEQQPSRRSHRSDEDEEEESSSVDARRRPEGEWPLWNTPVFRVTVDPQGWFHIAPFAQRGPFRSVGEALAAVETIIRARVSRFGPPDADGHRPHIWWVGLNTDIEMTHAVPAARIYTRRVPLQTEPPRLSPWSSWEYHITLRDGLFYIHPLDVGGPFHSLGEAATAIKCHTAWVSSTQLLTQDYYLTLKDGLFHVHPNNGIGGPFKRLQDATNAIRFDRAWRQEQKEKTRATMEFLKNLDPVAILAEMKELLKSDKRNPEPVKRSWVDDLEPEDCDPEISEAIDRMDRIIERRNAIREGMKWMQSEVLEAFEFYKTSTGYQGPKYEFVKLDQQCLIYDTFSNSYHHYNFTMKKKSSFYLSKKAKRSLKRPSRRGWDYQMFFAEVKSVEEGKQFICWPLQSEENGHCFGCQNVGIDLRHPASGEYEKGNDKCGFPFDSDSGSDY